MNWFIIITASLFGILVSDFNLKYPQRKNTCEAFAFFTCGYRLRKKILSFSPSISIYLFLPYILLDAGDLFYLSSIFPVILYSGSSLLKNHQFSYGWNFPPSLFIIYRKILLIHHMTICPHVFVF